MDLFFRYLLLDSIFISEHNPFSCRKIENYSVQCHNMLSQATNGCTAEKSNQHLHHLPLWSKNTNAGIISMQGASNYLTPRLLDPCMGSTQGDWFRNRQKTIGGSDFQLEKALLHVQAMSQKWYRRLKRREKEERGRKQRSPSAITKTSETMGSHSLVAPADGSSPFCFHVCPLLLPSGLHIWIHPLFNLS